LDVVVPVLTQTPIEPYVGALAEIHGNLCPRQVLGVRIALLACQSLEVPYPQVDKRTLMLAEMDGCFADGLSVVSGCSVGHRTLRVVDFGKIAVTAVDTHTNRAVRVWPRPEVRATACAYADGETRRWYVQRLGYARMPDAELLCVRSVAVPAELQSLCGPWHTRTVCVSCGEEVFQGRHVSIGGDDYCRACVRTGV
jgi:formylmethanofuran dehydrogenase subunit E